MNAQVCYFTMAPNTISPSNLLVSEILMYLFLTIWHFTLPVLCTCHFLCPQWLSSISPQEKLYNVSYKLLKSLWWSTPSLIIPSSNVPQKYLYLSPYILSVLLFIFLPRTTNGRLCLHFILGAYKYACHIVSII